MMCRIKRCDRPLKIKRLRLCMRHYQQYRRRHGLFTACSIDGCEQETYSKGWCRTHHRHWKASGDPLTVPVRPPHPKMSCKVPGCPNMTSAVQGQGFCPTHRNRLRDGLDLFAPVTPGKRGRKPYVPGIPEHVRRANSTRSYMYAKGIPSTPELNRLGAEYNRRVIAWRRTQRPPETQLARL